MSSETTLTQELGGFLRSLVVLSLIVFLIPAGTLFGALGGWVCGWFFGETVLHVFAQGGLINVSMWQLGAAVGFVASGFLRFR